MASLPFLFLFLFSLLQLPFSFSSSPLTAQPVPPSLFNIGAGCVQFSLVKLPLCSGQGRCVMIDNQSITVEEPNLPGSQCVCNPGWTGVNDFVDMDTHDCSTNLVVMKLLWSILFIVCFITIFVSLHKLQQATVQFKLKRKAVATGLRWWKEWFRYSPVVKICLGALIDSILMLVIALVRLVSPQYAIVGTTVLGSVFYGIWDFVFVVTNSQMSYAWLVAGWKFVPFIGEQAEAIKSLKRLRNYLRQIYLTILLAILFVILNYAFPSYRHFFTMMYNTAIFVQIASLCVLFLGSGRRLEKLLLTNMNNIQESSKKEREQAIILIRAFMGSETRASVGGILSMLVPGYWPWMRTKLAYINTWGLIFPLILQLAQLRKLVPSAASDKERTRQHSKINSGVMMETLTPSSNPSSLREGGRGGGAGKDEGGGATPRSVAVTVFPSMSSTQENAAITPEISAQEWHQNPIANNEQIYVPLTPNPVLTNSGSAEEPLSSSGYYAPDVTLISHQQQPVVEEIRKD